MKGMVDFDVVVSIERNTMMSSPFWSYFEIKTNARPYSSALNNLPLLQINKLLLFYNVQQNIFFVSKPVTIYQRIDEVLQSRTK